MNNYLHNMFHLLFFTIVTFSNNLVAYEVIDFRQLTVENDGLSESTVFDFNTGDLMIFLSDSLPEATNVKWEMLGYEAVYNCMLDNIERDPQTLLDTLSNLGTDWIKRTQLDDDFSLMIVRKN